MLARNDCLDHRSGWAPAALSLANARARRGWHRGESLGEVGGHAVILAEPDHTPKCVVMTRPRRSAALAARSATTNDRCTHRSVPSNRGVNGLRPCTARGVVDDQQVAGLAERPRCGTAPSSSPSIRSASFASLVGADHQVGVENHRRPRRVTAEHRHRGAQRVATTVEVALVDCGAEPALEQRRRRRRREAACISSCDR